MRVFVAILSLATAGVVGCSQPSKDARISQCKTVAEHYSTVKDYKSVSYGDGQVELQLVVGSALHDLEGYTSCQYEGESSSPSAITIGKTTHTEKADIDALLQGKYLSGRDFPDHAH